MAAAACELHSCLTIVLLKGLVFFGICGCRVSFGLESSKEFAKEYIPATPGSKPPHTMKEYEKFDTYCFGGYDPQLSEEQEARNYNEANWQQILAQEAIEEQLSKATVPSDSIAGPSKRI